MAIIGFGFEVFLHNKQWAPSQKSVWFILAFSGWNISSDFPSYSLWYPGACFLYKSYQKHAHNERERDLWTFHCSCKYCNDITLLWVLEKGLQRHRLELSQERKDTWSLSYKPECTLNCPLEDCGVGTFAHHRLLERETLQGPHVHEFLSPSGVHTCYHSRHTDNLKNFF